ncbi:uncharacterized protein LOC132631613 isoform X1 [Lycium barbarum]|uniref:uncharacterized protein LOC132631613 isoform X1 n=1 Tax=Lycium barbarum TaxID=112863 RepID=UPI00293EA320|nr:uncharacterized protein LOC132631613 isoform X1 [Lycium barbarum]
MGHRTLLYSPPPPPPPIMDYCIDARSRIQSHTERMRYWPEPIGEKEWRAFLVQLTGDAIQWKYPWLAGRPLVRTANLYFVELVGLDGIQPYAPLRVLRQFGVTHDVPVWSRMALHEGNYDRVVPVARVRILQREWLNMITIGMGDESWCTLEYYAWYNVGGLTLLPTEDGFDGLTNDDVATWLTVEIFPFMNVNNNMYRQVVPGSVNHLIQLVEEEDPVESEDEMGEDPEKEPTELDEPMEEDPEEDPEWESEHNLVMEVEPEKSPEYTPVGYSEGEPEVQSECRPTVHGMEEGPEYDLEAGWEIETNPEEELEYDPGPDYDPAYDGDDNDGPTWP